MNQQQAEFYSRAGRAVLFPEETDEHLDWMAKLAEQAVKNRDKAAPKSFIAMIYEAEVTRLTNGIIRIRGLLDAPAHQDGGDAGQGTGDDPLDQPSSRAGEVQEHDGNDLGEPEERGDLRTLCERVHRDTTIWLQDAREGGSDG